MTKQLWGNTIFVQVTKVTTKIYVYKIKINNDPITFLNLATLTN